MASPSSLTDPAACLVIDSSAAINITATGYGAEILSALPNELVAVDTIVAELEIGSRKGRPHADLFQELVASGHIRIVKLDESSATVFEDLVIGPAANTLDDGEAATLAYAANDGAIPIIDERKAEKICARKFPALPVGCSVDLLSHGSVEAALGRGTLSEAVHRALTYARMRVLPQHLDWVIDLIGPEKAASCRSLSRLLRRSISHQSPF
jgi:predicted nucleic acid-binding protein